MDFHHVVSTRRSVRAYQPRAVEEDKLDFILRCAVAAPSAGNLQPFEIVVVTRADVREAISSAALNQRFLAQAPVVLVFLHHSARSAADYGARGEKLYTVQDTAIACAYAQLAATSVGLGSCWVGAFDTNTIATLIGASLGLTPAAILAVGYADEVPTPTPRRPLAEIVHREKF
jgi:nitroreductase